VKALLDQLRASQAWQELQTANTGDSTHTTITNSIPSNPLFERSSEENNQSAGASADISSLLSRLQPPDPLPSSDVTPQNATASDVPSYSHKSSQYPKEAAVAEVPNQEKRDTRNLTYNQALPVLARLAEDPGFLKRIEKVNRIHTIYLNLS